MLFWDFYHSTRIEECFLPLSQFASKLALPFFCSRAFKSRDDDGAFYWLFVYNLPGESDGNGAHTIFFQLVERIFFKLGFHLTPRSHGSVYGCGHFPTSFPSTSRTVCGACYTIVAHISPPNPYPRRWICLTFASSYGKDYSRSDPNPSSFGFLMNAINV